MAIAEVEDDVTTTPTDESLFGQTYSQILEKLLKAGDNLQLVSPTIDWWWPTAPTGQIAARAYQLANSIPKWSPVGSFAPGASGLFQSYVQVLQQVNPSIPPDQQQAWTNAHNALVGAQNQWQNDQTAMYRAWVVATTGLPPGVPAPDYNDWLTKSGWAGTLLADSKQIAKMQENMANITGQMDPALKGRARRVGAAGGQERAQARVHDHGPGRRHPGSGARLHHGHDGPGLGRPADAGGRNQLSISVSQAKSSDNMTKSWAGAKASIDQVFWSVEASGSWSKLNIDNSDQAVEAQIDMTAAFVQVTPGQWYDGGYMKTLAGQGNFFSPWTAKGGSSPVFGEGGLLPVMITGLAVAYQPSFTITMSQNTYNQAQQQFDAALGVRARPVHLRRQRRSRVQHRQQELRQRQLHGQVDRRPIPSSSASPSRCRERSDAWGPVGPGGCGRAQRGFPRVSGGLLGAGRGDGRGQPDPAGMSAGRHAFLGGRQRQQRGDLQCARDLHGGEGPGGEQLDRAAEPAAARPVRPVRATGAGALLVSLLA